MSEPIWQSKQHERKYCQNRWPVPVGGGEDEEKVGGSSEHRADGGGPGPVVKARLTIWLAQRSDITVTQIVYYSYSRLTQQVTKLDWSIFTDQSGRVGLDKTWDSRRQFWTERLLVWQHILAVYRTHMYVGSWTVHVCTCMHMWTGEWKHGQLCKWTFMHAHVWTGEWKQAMVCILCPQPCAHMWTAALLCTCMHRWIHNVCTTLCPVVHASVYTHGWTYAQLKGLSTKWASWA